MTYLADACALLAFFGNSDSPMTKPGMSAMQGKVSISPITVWELTRKACLGKIPHYLLRPEVSRAISLSSGFAIRIWVGKKRSAPTSFRPTIKTRWTEC